MYVLAISVLAATLFAGTASSRDLGDRVSVVQGRDVSVAYDDGDVAVVGAGDVRSIDWATG